MNNYPNNLIRNLQDKMKNIKKNPKRKRKPVELRPSNVNSMKRRHPEFGYHKDYIHPWSLFQKGCALHYRQLTVDQRRQLQIDGKVPNISVTKSSKKLVKSKPLKMMGLTKSNIKSSTGKLGISNNQLKNILAKLQKPQKPQKPLQIKWKSITPKSRSDEKNSKKTVKNREYSNFFNTPTSPQKQSTNKSYNSLVMNKPPTKELEKENRKKRLNNLSEKLLQEKFSKVVVRQVARQMLSSGRPSSNYVKQTGKTKQK